MPGIVFLFDRLVKIIECVFLEYALVEVVGCGHACAFINFTHHNDDSGATYGAKTAYATTTRTRCQALLT